MLGRMQALQQMMGGNPQAMFEQAMRNNPGMMGDFVQFLEMNRGKSLEQVTREYAANNGVPFEQLWSYVSFFKGH